MWHSSRSSLSSLVVVVCIRRCGVAVFLALSLCASDPVALAVSCGDGVVNAPEECDDGGMCIGGTNAGMHCTKEPDCLGDGVCDSGFRQGYACSADAGCGTGHCVRCVPAGGDGCAANCTLEEDVPFDLVPGVVKGNDINPGTSGHPVYGDSLILPYPLSGTLTLTIGKDSGDGNIPVVVKAASEHFDRVHLPTLGAACLCARAVPAMTCGGTVFETDGTPSLDCTPGFTSGDSACSGRKPCAPVHGPGNSAAGVIACGGGGADTLAVTQDGSTAQPPHLTLSGSGLPGSALLFGSTAYVIGKCSGSDPDFFGSDGQLCTDDDPQVARGTPMTEVFVSHMATAEVLNANAINGSNIGPLAFSGATFSSCPALAGGNAAGACLVSAGIGLHASSVGDFVSGTTWCAAPPTVRTPTPTPTPSPTPGVPACIGDCTGDGAVSVEELIKGINMVLGLLPLDACMAFQCSPECHPGPGTPPTVTIDCIIRGVNNALSTCPPNVCISDKDCNDGNPCSDDRCTERGCRHQCVCD